MRPRYKRGRDRVFGVLLLLLPGDTHRAIIVYPSSDGKVSLKIRLCFILLTIQKTAKRFQNNNCGRIP